MRALPSTNGSSDKAAELLRRGDLASAVTEYARLFERNPNDWNLGNTLGDLYVKVGNIDGAVTHLTRVAEGLASEGFLVKARAIYRKILRLRPGNEAVRLRVAELEAPPVARTSPFLKRILETARSVPGAAGPGARSTTREPVERKRPASDTKAIQDPPVIEHGGRPVDLRPAPSSALFLVPPAHDHAARPEVQPGPAADALPAGKPVPPRKTRGDGDIALQRRPTLFAKSRPPAPPEPTLPSPRPEAAAPPAPAEASVVVAPVEAAAPPAPAEASVVVAPAETSAPPAPAEASVVVAPVEASAPPAPAVVTPSPGSALVDIAQPDYALPAGLSAADALLAAPIEASTSNTSFHDEPAADRATYGERDTYSAFPSPKASGPVLSHAMDNEDTPAQGVVFDRNHAWKHRPEPTWSWPTEEAASEPAAVVEPPSPEFGEVRQSAREPEPVAVLQEQQEPTPDIETQQIDYASAIGALEKLIEVGVDGGLNGHLVSVQTRLAEACFASGMRERARNIAIDLLARDPDAAAHRDLLARVCAEADQAVAFATEERIFAVLLAAEPDRSIDAPPAPQLPPPGIPFEAQAGVAEQTEEDPAETHDSESDSQSEGPVAGAQGAPTSEDLAPMAAWTLPDHPASPPADTSLAADDALSAWRDFEEVYENTRIWLLEESAAEAEEHLAASDRLIGDGLYTEAVMVLEEAACAPHLRFPASCRLAGVHLKRGVPLDALACLEWAADVPPPSEEAGHELAYNLALTLEALGETTQALGVYRELMAATGADYRDVATRMTRLAIA